MKKIKLFIIILVITSVDILAQFGMQQDNVQIESYISFDKVYPGSEVKLAVKVNVENGWHINSNKPYEDYLIPTSLSIDTSYFKIRRIVYPKPRDFTFDFSENPLSVYEGEIYIGALLDVSKDLSPGQYPLIVNLDYQACNDKSCLAPTSVQDTLLVTVADKQSVVNEINQDIFKKIDLSYSGLLGESEKKDDIISSTLEGSGLFLGLLLVFLGGLALNLTPCVYPLIPITVGYFGGQSEGSTGKLFIMGLLFLIGMAVTYSVIGVVTALTGSIFGAFLQNPVVILGIVLIFIVLSLSMFGVYEFKLPDSLVQKAGAAKQGYYGAFFMGLTMGIVAAPCIGPFVIGLVTYVAAKADPFFGFLLFFVLAVGLGFPYIFLAVFSGKIKKLPRAGEWMDAVKHIFGFILIGMALYFLLSLLPDSISGYILPIYMMFVALWLLFIEKLANSVKGFRIFKITFSLLILAVAVYAFVPEEKNSVNWKPYSEGVIPEKIDSKGVIIDFYADWCIPCKELDAFTFSDPRVIEESKKFYTYKADMTKSLSDEVETLRNKYKIIGVPTVLILDSKGNEVKRITGFVNADEFYEIIKNVN
ncbi:MAG: thiol:disulfide interchange protein [Ignavibacteria bacterium RBG_16_34_14]|nr:MAG: thiol:disulfide interchange protein [Ignavibacteria bacterium RBG_16_34_14]